VKREKNAKLAEGAEELPSLLASYMYLKDPRVLKNIDAAMKKLQSMKTTSRHGTKFKVNREGPE